MAAYDDEYHAYLIISLEARTMVNCFFLFFNLKLNITVNFLHELFIKLYFLFVDAMCYVGIV